MRTRSEAPALAVFRGAFVADWTVVQRLLDLEARGLTFELLADGRFRAVPGSALTADDRVFLRAHRDEAHAVITHYTGMTGTTYA
jgi:hypothetical protein